MTIQDAAGRNDPVHDEVYSLRDENVALKRRLNGQEDQTKKLAVQVQRLGDALRRNSAPASGKPRDRETEELVDELRSQLELVNKASTQWRNKAQYWKSIHEAETRKRGPYDHVGPRIGQTQPSIRKLVPAIGAATSPRRSNPSTAASRADAAAATSAANDAADEIVRLQDLVSMLRSKLAASESELERTRSELELAKRFQSSHSSRDDMDRVALQRELAETKRKLADALTHATALDEKMQVLVEAHAEAIRTAEEANAQLKHERRRNAELEEQLRNLQLAHQGEKSLLEIIRDLQNEKRLLQDELAKVLETALGTKLDVDGEDEEVRHLRQQLLVLQGKLQAAETLAQQYLQEKRDLVDRMEKILEELNAERQAHRALRMAYEDLKRRFDELEEQMRWIKNGPIPWADIEEALAFLKARRAKGHAGLEGMVDLDELEEYKRLLEEVRAQYAQCFEDLARTQRLLEVEQQLNKEFKAEIERLRRQLESLKNEYELRLEEDARLLDLRNHRIAMLEAQLNSLAMNGLDGAKAVHSSSTDDDDDGIELRPGENVLDVLLARAVFSAEGIEVLRSLGLDRVVNLDTPDNLLSFATFDFFDFETAVSGLGLGKRPDLRFRMRYRFMVNDFFMHYLQTRKAAVDLCACAGAEWVKIGSASVLFADLAQPGVCDTLTYYADLVSTHDEKTLLGKLELSMRVRIPMTQAIRAYKERSLALNLLTVTDDELSRNRFLSRAAANSLSITIAACSNLRAYAGVSPAVYLAYRFYQFAPTMSDTIRDTLAPRFAFTQRFDVSVVTDFDQYLRHEALAIYVLDDSSQFEGDFCYGVARIPLRDLAAHQTVSGEYEIRTPRGLYGGTVAVHFAWDKPFTSEIVPVVSQLHGREEAHEFSSVYDQEKLPASARVVSTGVPTDGVEQQSNATLQSLSAPVSEVLLARASDGSASAQNSITVLKMAPSAVETISAVGSEAGEPEDRREFGSGSVDEAGSVDGIAREASAGNSDMEAPTPQEASRVASGASSSEHISQAASSTHSRAESDSRLAPEPGRLSGDSSRAGTLENLFREPLAAPAVTNKTPLASLTNSNAGSRDDISQQRLDTSTAAKPPTAPATLEPRGLARSSSGLLSKSASLIGLANTGFCGPNSLDNSAGSTTVAAKPAEAADPTETATAQAAAQRQQSFRSASQESVASVVRASRDFSLSSSRGSSALLAEPAVEPVAHADSASSLGYVSELSRLTTPRDSISSAGGYTAANAETAAAAAAVEQMPDVTSTFALEIDQLEFNLRNPAVAAALTGVRQVFVCYDFCGCSPESLETQSLPLSVSSKPLLSGSADGSASLRRAPLPAEAQLQFHFRRSFDLAPDATDAATVELRRHLHEMLVSDDVLEASILFSVVSEPPTQPAVPNDAASGQDDGPLAAAYAVDCVDIGVAQINLRTWLQQQQQSSSKTPVQAVPVMDVNGQLQLGTLTLKLEGVSALERALSQPSE